LRKESSAARDTLTHAPEFAQSFLEILLRASLPALEAVNALNELRASVGREFNCPSQGVNEPTQEHMGCGPAGVAFEHLLSRGWFFSAVTNVGVVVGAKDKIIGVKEYPSITVELCYCALSS
jgi:hypothetical protein